MGLFTALLALSVVSHALAFSEHPFYHLLESLHPPELEILNQGNWPSRSLRLKDETQTQTTNSDVTESTFDQTINHFNGKTATFKQRYYVNKAYASGTKIHILYIEGSEVADPSHITNTNYTHVQIAKQLNATLWDLEHRLYGKSQPFKDVNVKYLNALSTRQAVEDIASFIAAQNKASGESNPKWILFGAFYGGSLALWTRQKYPSLTIGVVSSSAPAVPAADFYLYEKNVEDAFKNYNASCYGNMQRSVAVIRSLMQSDGGRQNLSTDFKLKPAFSELKLTYSDTQFFYVFLAFLFQQSVQFNKVNIGPFATKGGIEDVCKIFSNESLTDYGRMVSFVKYIAPVITGSSTFYGLPNSYSAFVKNLQGTSLSSSYIDSRSWFWQRCNEVGYFYTTDYGADYAFGSVIPSNFWINVCTDVFGQKFGVDTLRDGVKAARNFYGTTGITNVTNALITHGSVDPWRTVGVNSGVSSSASFYVIQEYGQAADLRPSTADDSYRLNFVRKLTMKKISAWLNPKGKKNSQKKSMKNKMPEIAIKHEDEAEKHRREANALKIRNWSAEIVDGTEYPKLKEPKRQKFRYEHTFTEELEYRMKKSNLTIKKKSITHGIIKQDVDHFSNNFNGQKWKQHYFYNGEFETDQGPTFLMVGGESKISQGEISRTFMATLAEEFGASMYTVEHRFYGNSQPTDWNLSVKNLEVLTFDQALADAAVFVKAMTEKTGRVNSTWIAFGGSYPGMLAAWFRLKYPDLIRGAVASSAPVQAQTDAYQYMQTVNKAVRQWGPKGCDKVVAALFDKLREMLNTVDGRRKLSIGFGMCQSWSEPSVDQRDVQTFLHALSGMVAGTVQYDDDEHQELEGLCGYLLKLAQNIFKLDKMTLRSQTSQKAMPHLDEHIRGFHARLPNHLINKKRRCWNVSYSEMLEHYADEEPYTPDHRSYHWQSCMHMGISESTDFGYSLFNSLTPTTFYTDMCFVFGKQFTRDVLDAGQRRTNAVYGGQDNFTASNVVWVNGSEDPWSPPSVYKPVGVNNTVILIDGTSHCYDMFPPYEEEANKVTDAHNQIRKAVRQMLSW